MTDRLYSDGEPLICPICRRSFILPEDGSRSCFPFCSDRCRTIDLARWLDGKYQIPVVEKDESDADGEVGGEATGSAGPRR